jgi:signal transduction histidine kinase
MNSRGTATNRLLQLSCAVASWRGPFGGLRRLTIRAVLLVAFSLIFALWLMFAYTTARQLIALKHQASQISTRASFSERALFTVRAEVLLGAVYLRDALLDPEPETPAYYRQQLLETKDEIERALQTSAKFVGSPAEHEELARLRTEVEDYWNTALPVLAWEPGRRAAEARALLRYKIIPKREVVIRISERIQALNRQGFERQQQQVSLVFDEVRWRLWSTTAVVALLGVGVAFLAIFYVGGLEREVGRQHSQVLEHRQDLQLLSARLVHAQEEERRSIARELHDEIGQALTAIKLDLSHAVSGPDAAESIRDARAIADRTLQEVRDLSQMLHPSVLDDMGLSAAVGWYLDNFSKRTGIRTDLLQEQMDGRFSAEVEIAAYRIVQEALTNVTRHAQANSCRVYMQRLAHTLLVTVEDDGRGFDPQAIGRAPHRGLGLVGIRERVVAAGGILRLESSPGKGTRVSVELPVESLSSAHTQTTKAD